MRDGEQEKREGGNWGRKGEQEEMRALLGGQRLNEEMYDSGERRYVWGMLLSYNGLLQQS